MKRGLGAAFLCEVCDDIPWWRITRRGDVATSWACPTDLSSVCLRMLRLGRKDELIITEQEPVVSP